MHRRSSALRSQAFTIVELIIVVAVIGILATVSIVGYGAIQANARDKAVLSDIEGVASEVTRYSVNNNGAYGTAVTWYSGGATNPHIKFTPSQGNVIDVVADDSNYCIRAYNPQAAKNSLKNAYIKSSIEGACNKLLPSSSAVSASPMTNTLTVTTLAGSTGGYVDGQGTAAQFNWPWDLAFGGEGALYLADAENYRVRKITTSALVSTFAGSGYGGGYTDGTGLLADFVYLQCIGSDSSGNLYVCDFARVRKITPAGVVSTITSAVGGAGLDVDGSGTIYLANGNLIYKITKSGTVSTFAGSTSGFADGNGVSARFNGARDAAVDSSGNVFIADDNNYRIRKITPSADVTTLAGGSFGTADGTGAAAQFDDLRSIAIGPSGDLYVTDRNRIRRITQAGVVTSVAGTTSAGLVNGVGTAARFSSLQGIVFDAYGTMYISDRANNVIRKME